MTTEAVCISIPTIVKASLQDGRRIIECEASCQATDLQGDVVLQKALLQAAPGFLAKGTIDQDHLSEIGSRLNPPIPNPLSYIVGRPLEVKDIGGGRTSVVSELHKSRAGSTSVADQIWESLQADPPVPWRASIFGYPTMDGFIDCSILKAGSGVETYGATRYLITALSWKSLALTLSPVCDGIENAARIVTAKAFIKSMTAKSMSLAPSTSPAEEMFANYMFPPRSRDELLGQYYTHICKGNCNQAGGANGNSVFSFRQHFTACCGMDVFQADIASLALMHLLKRESRS